MPQDSWATTPTANTVATAASTALPPSASTRMPTFDTGVTTDRPVSAASRATRAEEILCISVPLAFHGPPRPALPTRARLDVSGHSASQWLSAGEVVTGELGSPSAFTDKRTAAFE